MCVCVCFEVGEGSIYLLSTIYSDNSKVIFACDGIQMCKYDFAVVQDVMRQSIYSDDSK